MPPSKYERELRFIDTEVARLSRSLKDLADRLPDSPVEAAKKADDVLGIQDKISQLLTRKREIEDSFIKSGMEMPDIHRSMNATVHNAGAFEIHSPEEAEAKAFPPTERPLETADDISVEIKGVSDELMSIEVRMAQAEIDGNDSEMQKLQMMASSLRSRRETLIQRAKEMRAQKPAEESVAPVVDEKLKQRIDSLEADNRALRSQVGDVRNDIQDVKEQLRQILEALRIENNQ